MSAELSVTPGDGKKHIARAAGVMSIATFISRVLGYVKDMILAIFFGASGLSDTFFVEHKDEVQNVPLDKSR